MLDLRLEAKTIRSPFGDQTAPPLKDASNVNRVSAPRARSCSHRSALLPLIFEIATVFSSGERWTSQYGDRGIASPSALPERSNQARVAPATERPPWWTRTPLRETESGA